MRSTKASPRSLVVALLAAFWATACTQPPAPPPSAPRTTEGPRVIFPDGFVVRVEIVADEESRAQGLMYRDQLLPGTGMLFLFPADGTYPFWMKNTRIPLDMIWIDASRRVAHLKHGVPPCLVDPCPSYDPGVPARYVLEVAGGVAGDHGVAEGAVLRFEGIGQLTP